MDVTFQSALVAAGTSVVVLILNAAGKYYWEKYFHRYKLEQEHRHEQQKKLKKILSQNKGQLLSIAEQLNHRLWNFWENHKESWMIVNGDYSSQTGNYFRSFTYRFCAFFAWIRRIERDLIYVDGTFAQKDDLEFVKFIRTLPQIFCDVKLFSGFKYDRNYAVDHFFRNDFENIMESLFVNAADRSVMSFEEFSKSMDELRQINEQIFVYFDGISWQEEARYRWDVLKVFHLLLMAFLNTFGYDFQQTNPEKIKKVMRQPRPSRLSKNFVEIIVRNKLAESKSLKPLIQGQDIV